MGSLKDSICYFNILNQDIFDMILSKFVSEKDMLDEFSIRRLLKTSNIIRIFIRNSNITACILKIDWSTSYPDDYWKSTIPSEKKLIIDHYPGALPGSDSHKKMRIFVDLIKKNIVAWDDFYDYVENPYFIDDVNDFINYCNYKNIYTYNKEMFYEYKNGFFYIEK